MIGLFVVFLPLVVSALLLIFYRAPEDRVGSWLNLYSWLGISLTLVLLLGRAFGVLPELVDEGLWFQELGVPVETDFLFDLKALCLIGLSSFLFWIILRFARVYMHREAGFHRFFRTLLLSHFGLNMIATAGNFELFFIGWEVLGLSSFLLIGFYRDRATPVLNAFKIYCVYRICDIGILMSGFVIHHEFGLGGQFPELSPSKISHMVSAEPVMAAILGASILLAALGKSAQFPFSFWLPRALEGPTPSSAVFYGALSIHAGVYLLLRTQAIWSSIPYVSFFVFLFGGMSVLVGTMSGRAQANIKGQIGYASVAQVGIMLMEVALGWNDLALLHLCTHAILRAYQFLTSPSIVAHFIRHPVRDQHQSGFGFFRRPWMRRLSVGEFFIEEFWNRVLVRPVMSLGSSIPLLALLLLGLSYGLWSLGSSLKVYLVMSGAFVLSIRAISRKSPKEAILFSFVSMMLVIYSGTRGFLDPETFRLFLWVMIAGALLWLSGQEKLKFLAWLVFAGFPISPFFLGEELLLQHLGDEGFFALTLFFGTFILNGLVLIRSFLQETWLAQARPLD
ncbi:MAG: hypothetical protein KGP28_03090 [Bdellovibrionales bacterium]|nr:hypothetical protein [Bdellovibrionales bacterium]